MDLTIIICVYNGEKYLPRAIESLLGQKDCPFEWEILAINDGSSDRSAETLSRYAEKEPERIRIISRENRGVGSTRSEGIARARGEFVTFLDCDDFVTPDFLGETLPVIREKELDILLFDSRFIYPDGTEKPYPASNAAEGFLTPREYMLSMPGPWNKIVRKTLYTENRLSFPEGIWYEDLAVIPSLAKSCAERKIYYLKKDLHRYVQSPGSITRAEGETEKWMDILPALLALKENLGTEFETEAEYLAWFHLYRSFVWKFYPYRRFDRIDEINCFMKRYFPAWSKNFLIRREGLKEKLVSKLFYHGKYNLIGLWKKEVRFEEDSDK